MEVKFNFETKSHRNHQMVSGGQFLRLTEHAIADVATLDVKGMIATAEVTLELPKL